MAASSAMSNREKYGASHQSHIPKSTICFSNIQMGNIFDTADTKKRMETTTRAVMGR
jgi:hypothetical protein